MPWKIRVPYWNLIRESVSKKQWQQVLAHYQGMKKSGLVLADPLLFPPILKVYANLGSFKLGTSVHAALIKKGLESHTSITNSIMDFYIKCTSMDSALTVFNFMVNKHSVSWNIMIHGYLDNCAFEQGLSLFTRARLAGGFEPNIAIWVLVLSACRSLRATHVGLYIHGLVIQTGYSDVVSVQNSLLSMYSKFGNIGSARRLFDEMPERDVISWSAMISGYAQAGEAPVALQLFRDMVSQGGFDPDELTVVSILQACTFLGDIDQGRLVHGYVICRGFEFDLFVGNSLIDMYSKCVDVNAASKVFDNMPRRNIVSWNSMLSGLVHNDQYLEALTLFDLMKMEGIEADEVTVVNLLQSCKNLGGAVHCKSIHSLVIRKRFETNLLVLNSLLDAYAKCELIHHAWKLFERVETRNLISWSTIIAGFAHCGKPDEALAVFQEMKLVQEKPNSVTMLSLLEACSLSADIKRSKWAHGIAIRNGLDEEVAVGTALLNMYAKCGEIADSRKVFNEMPERNVVSWSAMVSAYGMNGSPHEALALLGEMESHSVKPNKVTMLSMLSACSHGGLVEEGRSCFEDMARDHGLKPCQEHYSCMVDMLGRAGEIQGAMDVIKMMPEGVEAGPSVWSSVLSACRNYRNSEVGEGVASRVLEVEPLSSAGYMLASSMYAVGSSWQDAARMRWLAKEKGVRAVAGYSLVHVDQKANKFIAGDRSHQWSEEIYAMVRHLHSCMKSDNIHFEVKCGGS